MAAQLGLDAIPVERQYLESWMTADARWKVKRVVSSVPAAVDTGAGGGECSLVVQDKRVLDRTEESKYFGVNEPKPAAGPGGELGAAADPPSHAPTAWKWLAHVNNHLEYPAEVPPVWVACAVIRPPPRSRSITFGTARSAASRRKHLMYNVKNKAKQELDLTREGEAVVDHLGLNALLFLHGKDVYFNRLGENSRVYVTIAGAEPPGAEPGWEGRELHFAASARINALGENLGLDPERRAPITMLNAPRLPFTVAGEDQAPNLIWHLFFIVPPPSALTPGQLMRRDERLVDDLAEAAAFARRTGAKLAVMGLELEGVHARNDAASRIVAAADACGLARDSPSAPPILPGALRGMVNDPETVRELLALSSDAAKGDAAKTDAALEAHWLLQRDDVVGAVEAALRRRHLQDALHHRRRVQQHWLEAWTHRGMTLSDAADAVSEGKKGAKWARDWFEGFARAHHARSAVRGAASFFFDDARTRRGRAYVTRNARAMIDATRRFLDGDVTERGLLEEMLRDADRESHGGWTPAGARTAWNALGGVGPDAGGGQQKGSSANGSDASSGGGGAPFSAGKQTAAQRAALRAARAAADGGLDEGGTRGGNGANEEAAGLPSAQGVGSSSSSELEDDADAALLEDPDDMWRAFWRFRDVVDLVSARDAAADDADVFEVLLDDIEARLGASGASSGASLSRGPSIAPSLAPLHVVAAERVARQLANYRRRLADEDRSTRLADEDDVLRRCGELSARAGRVLEGLEALRRSYDGARAALDAACAEGERGMAVGDLDAMAGTEAEATFEVGKDDAPFSTSAWRIKLDALDALVETVRAMRAVRADPSERIPEGATIGDGGDPRRDPSSDGSGTDRSVPSGRAALAGTPAPPSDPSVDRADLIASDASDASGVDEEDPGRAVWTVTHANLSEPFELTLESILTIFGELKYRAPERSSASVSGAESAAAAEEADARRVVAEWTALGDAADATLRRASDLRGKMAAAVDVIAASDKIDPSGIRAAIERARVRGAPALVVQAAEAKLADLEEDIAAFVRHRRAGESLLPPPKKSWSGAGRHIWYDETAELGRGSLGTTVYAGVYDETAGSSSVVRRPAAIKRIPLPPGDRGASVRALVEREVALHRHLNQNSNRVTFLLGVHLDANDAVFTAMERCGESLAQWLRNAPGGNVAELSPAERLRAAEALTAAVADVHAAGVTHNDIKPDNCLRAASGEFKLADLGLGVRLKSADRGAENEYSMTTFAGYGVNVQLRGRPPEVLQGLNLTSAVDVWSLGNLIYATFTGEPSPYADPGSEDARGGHGGGGEAGIEGLYENQRILRGSFSLRALETSKLPRHTIAAARRVLHDMLQPDPADRPTAAEVLAHPVFWSPETALEKIREVHDKRRVPLRERGGHALTADEELALIADGALGALGDEERLHQNGGDPTKGSDGDPSKPPRSTPRSRATKGGASAPPQSKAEKDAARLVSLASRLHGWKDLVIPELLERVTKFNIKRQYQAGSDQLQRAKDEAREASLAAKEAEEGRGGTHRAKGRRRGRDSLSLRAAAARGDWDGTGYEPTLRDLFRFVRNVHEHPGLQAERHAMVRALGGAGTRLLKDTAHSGEDRWGAARRVTEAYVMHVFPELPLLAHALLTERARAAAEKVGGKSPR